MQLRGVRFRVPSAEYQIIHLILGKFVHDSYMARHMLPIREACDYLEIQERTSRALDYDLIERHCRNEHQLFAQLVNRIIGLPPGYPARSTSSAENYLRLVELRYDSEHVAGVLDAYAKISKSYHSLVHNYQKLPRYLGRKIGH